MSRTMVALVALVAFGAGATAGVFGLLWATGGNAQPSRDARDVAPTLSLDDPTPTPGAAAQVAAQLADLNQKLDAVGTQVAAANVRLESLEARMAGSDAASAASASLPPSPTPTPATAAAAGAELPERALFRIAEAESEARFKIEEVLLGNPTTVVGATRRVAGDIIVNFRSPASSQIGTIAINARTLKTDQEFRDQAIRGQILQSSRDEYEFIEFTPVELINLPDTPATFGSPLLFQIRGDLKIRDVTRSVVFDAAVTPVAPDRIEGLVSVTVRYSDFGLEIKAPPQVSSVGETVTLELEFVALAVPQ